MPKRKNNEPQLKFTCSYKKSVYFVKVLTKEIHASSVVVVCGNAVIYNVI